MSDKQRGPEPSFLVTTFQYDPEGRLVSVEAPTPPGSKWELDEAKRVFRLTEPDCKVPNSTTDPRDFSSSPRTRRPASRNR
jgi:hypothetical protein